jgi:hypothetical protein
MTNKIFLSAQGVVYFFFALALFFIPTILWPIYGLELNGRHAVFLSQHNSIFLGGIGIISFLMCDAAQGSDTARKILMGLMATNILGVIITLYACFIGVFSGFGWSDPIFFALLAIFSFVQLRKNQ